MRSKLQVGESVITRYGLSTCAPSCKAPHLPAEHREAVGTVDPGGHAYPALHVPLHEENAVAEDEPYHPPGQSVQLTEPLRE